MVAQLSVNMNAIAYLRNRRPQPWPDLVMLGRLALASGAAGLTVHPRKDQRHIRSDDVPALAEMIRQEFPHAEYNIEGYPDEAFLKMVEKIKPNQVTLVPDAPEQATSDHGWDIPQYNILLDDVIARLHKANLRVSLFIEALPGMVDWAQTVGADRVELYTGPYGAAREQPEKDEQLALLRVAGHRAAEVGIGLNAGHDLTRENLPPLVQLLPNLAEVSIGHAITADALEFGLEKTVKLYREALAPQN